MTPLVQSYPWLVGLFYEGEGEESYLSAHLFGGLEGGTVQVNALKIAYKGY